MGVVNSSVSITPDTVNLDVPPEPLHHSRKKFPNDPGCSAEDLDRFIDDEIIQHKAIAVRKANELSEESHDSMRVPIVWGSTEARVFHTYEPHRPLKDKSYDCLHIGPQQMED